MPNWCYVTLEANASKEELQKFYDKVIVPTPDSDEGQVLCSSFDFNTIIPMPNNVFRGNLGNAEREQCERDGIPNWYDWSCDNWGTKWNAAFTEVFWESDERLFINFATAWSYPEHVMTTMFSMFPNIEFVAKAEEESGQFYFMHHSDGTFESGSEVFFAENGNEITYDHKTDKWVDADNNIYEDYAEREIIYP